jgi:hypothetical protein
MQEGVPGGAGVLHVICDGGCRSARRFFARTPGLTPACSWLTPIGEETKRIPGKASARCVLRPVPGTIWS